MNSRTIFKLLGAVLVILGVTVHPAGAVTISKGGAQNICSRHGGTTSGSWGSGCGWCSRTGNTCGQVTCKSGKCDVILVHPAARAPTEPKGPVASGAQKQPTSGGATIYSHPNGGSQQFSGGHTSGGGGGGGHK